MTKQNIFKSRLQQRNDTAARWAEVNPVLLKGEIGIELDTKRQKVGDGVTPWNDLDYLDKALYEAIKTEKDRLDTANADLTKITNLLKNGATLDEAKSALAEFGEGYRDLYEVAKTLHTFLNLEDPNDVIDRWQEVASFLQGITDAQTLTGLLESLRSEITTAYQNAVKALSDRVDALEEFNEEGALEDKINEVVDERFADDVYILDGGNAAGYTI